MSGRIVQEVLKYAPEDLTKQQLLVFVALAESARERDRTARFHVTVAELAHKTRSTPGTVKNALGELSRRGLIKPLHQARAGLAQNYRLHELQEHHRRATNE